MHPVSEMLVVVIFLNGDGGVGVLLSSFLSRGAQCHSQIRFVVAFIFMDTDSSSDRGDVFDRQFEAVPAASSMASRFYNGLGCSNIMQNPDKS